MEVFKTMKKFFKSKVFLAVLAVVLVSSMLMAGTYSWFVISKDGVGASASVQAAKFDFTGELDVTVKEISLWSVIKDKENFEIPSSVIQAFNTLTNILGNNNVILSDDIIAALDFMNKALNDELWVKVPLYEGINVTFTKNPFTSLPTIGAFDLNAAANNAWATVTSYLEGALNGLGADELEHVYIYNEPQVGSRPIPQVDGKYLIYPGDGIKFTVNLENLQLLENNRDVVVGLDLGFALNAIDDAYKLALNAQSPIVDYPNIELINNAYLKMGIKVSDDDIYYEDNLNILDLSDWYDAGDGKYYIYVPAGKGENLIDLNAKLEIIFGIVGIKRNQNHYMDAVLLNLNAFDSVKATAVQATEWAVEDVFGPGVWSGLAPTHP
jgi:hypothetical protein